LDRRLGGIQNQTGRGREEKNSQPLPGLELPTIQPVAQRYTTELFDYNLPPILNSTKVRGDEAISIAE
jgi:hypothetical protein